MKQLKGLIATTIILFLPIAAQAQKVNVDFDKGVDFSKFKTFMLTTGTPVANPMSNQRIIAGIEAQLASKGLQKVEGNADLEVMYHGAVGHQTQINSVNMGGWGYGWGGYGGMGTTTTTVQNIPTGELVVDIGDIQAKKFIWRGTARDTLSDNPQKNQKKLEKALTKMFQKYPPPVKK